MALDDAQSKGLVCVQALRPGLFCRNIGAATIGDGFGSYMLYVTACYCAKALNPQP